MWGERRREGECSGCQEQEMDFRLGAQTCARAGVLNYCYVITDVADLHQQVVVIRIPVNLLVLDYVYGLCLGLRVVGGGLIAPADFLRASLKNIVVSFRAEVLRSETSEVK